MSIAAPLSSIPELGKSEMAGGSVYTLLVVVRKKHSLFSVTLPHAALVEQPEALEKCSQTVKGETAQNWIMK